MATVLKSKAGSELDRCICTKKIILMKQENALQLFEDKKVRTLWDAEQEKWYLSIIDVIEVLTGSPRPRKY